MEPISESNGTISFDVTVTNTGSVAGKDVVEVYYNPPYLSSGIEKASANLAAPVNLFDFARGEIECLFPADGFANFGYMDATRSIYNGGSSCLINRDVTTNNVTDTSNPLTVQQMRQACKDILYTGVNSRGHAPENIDTGLMSWQIILIAADVALAVVVVLLEVAIFKA